MKTRTMVEHKVVKLGNVCELIKGKKPERFIDKGMPYLTAKSIRKLETPKFVDQNDKSCVLVNRNDLVIIMDGSNSGELFTGLEGALASTMGIIKHQDIIDNYYLLYFLRTHRENFSNSRTGSAIPHLNKDQFNKLELGIPSLEEQRRIVKRLNADFEKIDRAIKLTKRNRINCDNLLRSESIKTFAIPTKDYESSTLGEMLHIARGGSPRPIKEYQTTAEDGINWIKIGDVKVGAKYITQTKEKIKPSGLHKTRLVEPGDFLLSNSMSFGRPYIMKIHGAIHDGWLALKSKQNELDNDYLYHFLGSDYAFMQFDKLAAGSTVRNLNTQTVSKVMIHFPKSIYKQKEIASRLDTFAEKTKAASFLYEQKLVKLGLLKQSLLSQAFSESDVK